MSHLISMERGADPEVAYRLLQERLDRNLTGAPDSPTFRKILHLLFTPEQANVARLQPPRAMVNESTRSTHHEFTRAAARMPQAPDEEPQKVFPLFRRLRDAAKNRLLIDSSPRA